MAAAQALTHAEINRLLQPRTPFLVGVEIENLRGFRRARIDLRRDLIVLVGPNNSGKTSIFRLLDWLLNEASEETLAGANELSAAEQQLLIPARNTRGGARRIVLLVSIADRRRQSRFTAESGISRLRFRVRNNRVYANVSPPRKSEPLQSEQNALQLLRELRESTYFRHVPASREVGSDRFKETLTTALEARLSERAIHQARAGAPADYREVRRALGTLREVAERLAQPLWQEMQRELVPTLSRNASLKLAVDPPALVHWMAERIELKLVTGEHDPGSVFPTEVGSGLQSLLDLAMFSSEDVPANADVIFAIEEPEAFLHPTAQRTLARQLAARRTAKRLISTHSQIFVEEAGYENIALVRDHQVFQPGRRGLADTERVAVNSALLSGQGAEMAFARGTLLVEGEADRLFFERLRRRLAQHDPSGRLDELTAVWVGSNTRFGPWIRLLESYTADGVRPIQWLVVADGVDSASALRRAFEDARFALSGDVTSGLTTAAMTAGGTDRDQLTRDVRRLNQTARRAAAPLLLLPIDLEHAALNAASPDTVATLAGQLSLAAATPEELVRLLGSKSAGAVIARASKQPWMRAAIAAELPFDELSEDVVEVLRRWFRMTLEDGRAVNDVFRRAGVPIPR